MQGIDSPVSQLLGSSMPDATTNHAGCHLDALRIIASVLSDFRPIEEICHQDAWINIACLGKMVLQIDYLKYRDAGKGQNGHNPANAYPQYGDLSCHESWMAGEPVPK